MTRRSGRRRWSEERTRFFSYELGWLVHETQGCVMGKHTWDEAQPHRHDPATQVRTHTSVHTCTFTHAAPTSDAHTHLHIHSHTWNTCTLTSGPANTHTHTHAQAHAHALPWALPVSPEPNMELTLGTGRGWPCWPRILLLPGHPPSCHWGRDRSHRSAFQQPRWATGFCWPRGGLPVTVRAPGRSDWGLSAACLAVGQPHL